MGCNCPESDDAVYELETTDCQRERRLATMPLSGYRPVYPGLKSGEYNGFSGRSRQAHCFPLSSEETVRQVLELPVFFLCGFPALLRLRQGGIADR